MSGECLSRSCLRASCARSRSRTWGGYRCLDALLAKSSMSSKSADRVKVAQELLPAICRIAESDAAPLGTKVRALKARSDGVSLLELWLGFLNSRGSRYKGLCSFVF